MDIKSEVCFGKYEDGTIVNDTLFLQENSVVMFANRLGYFPQRMTNGVKTNFIKFGEGKKANTIVSMVRYNTMVRLHNGYNVGTLDGSGEEYLSPESAVVEYFSKLPIKLDLLDFSAAYAGKIVDQAKLQQTKNGRILVQSHKVRYASLYAKVSVETKFGSI